MTMFGRGEAGPAADRPAPDALAFGHPPQPKVTCDECGAAYFVSTINWDGVCEHLKEKRAEERKQRGGVP